MLREQVEAVKRVYMRGGCVQMAELARVILSYRCGALNADKYVGMDIISLSYDYGKI